MAHAVSGGDYADETAGGVTVSVLDDEAAPVIVAGGVEVSSFPRATYNTYGVDETIAVGVTFDSDVEVNTTGGTPYIKVQFKNAAANAPLTRKALQLRGAVPAAPRWCSSTRCRPLTGTTTGSGSGATRLVLDGGTIRDSDGRDAQLAHGRRRQAGRAPGRREGGGRAGGAVVVPYQVDRRLYCPVVQPGFRSGDHGIHGLGPLRYQVDQSAGIPGGGWRQDHPAGRHRAQYFVPRGCPGRGSERNHGHGVTHRRPRPDLHHDRDAGEADRHPSPRPNPPRHTVSKTCPSR